MLNRPLRSSKNSNFKAFSFLATFLLLFVLILPAEALQKQSAVVHEVLTGDTLRLEGGKTLRYVGMQAPPLQSVILLVREYGANALEFNKKLVEGRRIWIEWGSQIRDDQNNLLGYVFLEDGTFVNLEMIKAGHGRALKSAPNIKYSGAFRKAELGARRAKKGLWKEEPENPFIKSEYIGDTNTKIFYFPTSPELERISPSRFVKFRSRVEAKAAGYKACSTCKGDQDDYFASEGIY